MKIKVCGLRDPKNTQAILQLQPDYIGHIFYHQSQRLFKHNELNYTEKGKSKSVGVFVNSTEAYIREKITSLQLDLVQLHGNESPNFCMQLSSLGVKIIKAFQVDSQFDFNTLNAYIESAQYFLFDTKTSSYGGSGRSFNWEILENYQLNKPYFLSGGIALEDVDRLISHKAHQPNLYGIDINSKFEKEPGIKEINMVASLIEQIRNEVPSQR